MSLWLLIMVKCAVNKHKNLHLDFELNTLCIVVSIAKKKKIKSFEV